MRFQATTALRLLALFSACLLAVSVAQARGHKTTKSESRTAKSGYKSAAKSASHKHGKAARSRRARKPRGQQQIDAERAREIQNALIRERYLAGEATGQWDQRTKDAMTRFQADHGWQTRVLPDARALIALGLGPSRNNLLNPQTAALPRAVTPAAQGLADTTGAGDEPQHR